MDEQNTTTAAPVRVKYGQGQDMDVPLSWAQAMLGSLYLLSHDETASAAERRLFGKLLTAAATGNGRR